MRALGRMGPYLVSHHPHCGPFRADVLVAGGRRWCIACFVGYPMLAVAWVGAWAADSRLGLPWWAWLAAGLCLASVQAASFAGKVPSWRHQVGVKAALGIGLGFACHALLSLPLPLHWRLPILLLALMAIQSLWVLRFHRLERTCKSCPQLPLRPGCEGLSDLEARVGHIVSGAGWKKVG